MDKPKYRHIKRGTTYTVVLDDIEFQLSRNVNDGDSITVYRCIETGKLWARPSKEFYDKNRFVKIT